MLDEVTAQCGAPTILVNNAGIHLKAAALDTSDAAFFSVLETHVLGAFALTRAVAPAMVARGSGNILFISSMAALIGIPQVTAYAAAAACITNLGPGLGDVSANYASLSSTAKVILSFAMLMGRLEIFTLLVLFSPAFWRN